MVKPELTALEHLEGCRKHPASQCSSMPKRPHQNKTHCGCVDCVDGGEVDSSRHSLQNIGWLPLADTCQTACPKGTLAMDTDLICNSKNKIHNLRIFESSTCFQRLGPMRALQRRHDVSPLLLRNCTESSELPTTNHQTSTYSVYVCVRVLQPTIQQFNNIKLLLELFTLAYCRCHSTFNFRRQSGDPCGAILSQQSI